MLCSSVRISLTGEYRCLTHGLDIAQPELPVFCVDRYVANTDILAHVTGAARLLRCTRAGIDQINGDFDPCSSRA